ncbi:Protein of unknown function [Franzmannia pantelleriensis]|uniref:SAM-dependent methyltransferase n=1 Tax=Franzmannia pantelleriensis TaxID=48727 RepID=A0A1G9R4V9_9GAMM|nr:DUF938 domain-containing protein [Halomonas pantelleriensis]SDM18319.1 Protein of unknown function [Halomonas pantelleriensis]
MDTLDKMAAPGPDRRLSSPAAARNREPILKVLRDWLPIQGRVLEVASGSGEHALHFATAMPNLRWQPSDPSPSARASIEAWRVEQGPANLLAPLALNVEQRPWPVPDFDVLLAINLLHISPWAVSEALFAEAGARLPDGGILYLYGPFMRDGEHSAASNAAFDADLRQRDPEWGIRELETVLTLAERHGLGVVAVEEMPANNLSVVLRAEAVAGS